MQNEQSDYPDQNINVEFGDGEQPPLLPPKKSEPVFNLPAFIIAVIVLCVAVHAVNQFVLSAQWQEWVLINFAYFPLRYTPEYLQFDLPTLVSPISYSLLHGGWLHLGMNIIWLVAFGAPVVYRIGALRSLIFWVLTALGSVLLHTAIYFGDPIPLVGASGAVSGFLGAAARFGFRANRANPRAGLSGPLYGPVDSLRQRGVLSFLLIWMVINYAFGSGLLSSEGGSSIAWEAHIGGLLTGFFAIGLLDRRPN